MSKNYHRAGHKVNNIFDYGYNVKLTYKGYEVSLASDGEDTIVFEGLSPALFTAIGTTGEAVKSCFDFIDSMEKV